MAHRPRPALWLMEITSGTGFWSSHSCGAPASVARISSRASAGGERALLADAPTTDHAALATLIWSAKESALKAIGEGLRRDTRGVAVNVPSLAGPAFTAGQWEALSAQEIETEKVFKGWWLAHPDYVLTALCFPHASCLMGLESRAE